MCHPSGNLARELARPASRVAPVAFTNEREDYDTGYQIMSWCTEVVIQVVLEMIVAWFSDQVHLICHYEVGHSQKQVHYSMSDLQDNIKINS